MTRQAVVDAHLAEAAAVMMGVFSEDPRAWKGPFTKTTWPSAILWYELGDLGVELHFDFREHVAYLLFSRKVDGRPPPFHRYTMNGHQCRAYPENFVSLDHTDELASFGRVARSEDGRVSSAVSTYARFVAQNLEHFDSEPSRLFLSLK